MCVCVYACTCAHTGASALNKVTESSLALPKASERCCSVYAQFSSVGGHPRGVCVGCWCAAECVCRGGGLVWTEWTLLISCLIKGIALGEETGRGGCTAHLRVYLMETSLSLALPTHTPSLAGVFGYDFALHSYRHTCCMTRLCNAGDYSLRTETRRSASLALSPPSYHLHLSSSSRSSDTRCSLAQRMCHRDAFTKK